MGTVDAVAEFGAPTVTIVIAWVLLVRGRKGFGWEQRGGRKSVHNVGVDRDGGLTQFSMWVVRHLISL